MTISLSMLISYFFSSVWSFFKLLFFFFGLFMSSNPPTLINLFMGRFLESAKSLLLVFVLSSSQNLLFYLFSLYLTLKYFFLHFYNFCSHFSRALKGNRCQCICFHFRIIGYLSESIYPVFISDQKLSTASKY